MLNFHLFDYNTDFDLLTGEVPTDLRFSFGDQVQRARKILKNRSEKEIRYALDSLDWMLQTGSNQLFAIAINEAKEVPNGVTVNRVKALKAWMPHYDISEQHDFPNATWAEYFAILTLAYVAELLIQEKYSPSIKSDSPVGLAINEHIRRHGSDIATQWALEAMEAISYAEQLQQASETETQSIKIDNEQIKAFVAARGSKGGTVRAAKFNTLRQTVAALYDEKYTKLSNREAAKRIYKEIKDEIDAVLRTDDPEQQLAKWIGEHKRNNKRS